MESGPDAVCWGPGEEREARLGSARRWLREGSASEGTGAVEGCGIQPVRHIVVSAVSVLAGYKQGEAAQRCRRALLAAHTERLTVLKRQDVVHRPAAHNRIHPSTARVTPVLAPAQGEFIRAAEMDDIAHIEIGQRPIALNPETWKVRCLPPADIAVQQITRRGEDFAVGIVAENAQAFTEAVLVVDQSRVVRAVAFRSGIARTLVEIRKRDI